MSLSLDIPVKQRVCILSLINEDRPDIFLEVDSEIIFYIKLRNHMNF